MVTNRQLKSELLRNIAGELAGRGYEKTGSETWRRPVAREGDLTVRLESLIEGGRYGGATVTGTVAMVSPEVQRFFDAHVPVAALGSDREESLEKFLGMATFGQLLTEGRNYDVQWDLRESDDVQVVTQSFCSTVDGVVDHWIRERNTVDQILQTALEVRLIDLSLYSGRACVVLALHNQRADVAAALMLRMVSKPRVGEIDVRRLAAFQNVLSENFPDYRPVELTAH